MAETPWGRGRAGEIESSNTMAVEKLFLARNTPQNTFGGFLENHFLILQRGAMIKSAVCAGTAPLEATDTEYDPDRHWVESAEDVRIRREVAMTRKRLRGAVCCDINK